MNTRKYTSFLARPQDISSEDVKELNAILDAYPYFQSARALQLKGLKIQNSFLYNEALKVTAAYTTDRDVLFDYITSNVFIQDEISELILQNADAIKEIPVFSENVTEAVSLEIDKQLKAEIKKAEAILNPKLFERKEDTAEISKEAPIEKAQADPSIATNSPLTFTKKETHSFNEWLKLTQAQPIDRNKNTFEGELTESSPIQRKFHLIEKFIQDQPKLKPLENTGQQIDLSEPYTRPAESLMTETLARVYLQQKNYKKAIQAYKILILKNPEKSGFFADQIRAIQKMIKE
jgi:hypothetical protein